MDSKSKENPWNKVEALALTKNYITPAGYARLKDELKDLLDRERPEIVKTVAWAAANGDRSENADYIYGKRRLREIDRRIRFLTKQLDAAHVVKPAERDSDQVFFGATVTVCDAKGRAATYTIVGVDESDASRGLISWVSPIAKALLKARAGDLVKVAAPGGAEELEVIAVRYGEG
ncbi:MAG: transcription elongation factor GreB [Burkholderiales bacterium]